MTTVALFTGPPPSPFLTPQPNDQPVQASQPPALTLNAPPLNAPPSPSVSSTTHEAFVVNHLPSPPLVALAQTALTSLRLDTPVVLDPLRSDVPAFTASAAAMNSGAMGAVRSVSAVSENNDYSVDYQLFEAATRGDAGKISKLSNNPLVNPARSDDGGVYFLLLLSHLTKDPGFNKWGYTPGKQHIFNAAVRDRGTGIPAYIKLEHRKKTPLHMAAWGGHVEAVRILLKWNDEKFPHMRFANAKDGSNKTPYDYARENRKLTCSGKEYDNKGAEECTQILAPITDEKGYTPPVASIRVLDAIAADPAPVRNEGTTRKKRCCSCLFD